MNREVEFGQKAFVAGTFVGVRSFRVDDVWVTGCAKRVRWTPGVNEARCVQDYVYAFAQPSPRPPHTPGALSCTCGFYAYFDQRANPHHERGNVLGIVEGFGTVTAGSRGFRAEKARIVALIEEDTGFRIRDCGCSRCSGAQRPDFHAIAKHYGDLPVFPTVDAAVAEFPLTPVDVPITESDEYEHPQVQLHGFATIMLSAQQLAEAFARAMQQITASAQRFSANLVELKLAAAATDETPAQRALRLRRERNTGPQNRIGLDGVRRSR